MNKSLRIVLAFVFLVAIVAIGMNGTAWASKLQAGQNGVAQPAPLAAGARPHGSVLGDSELHVPSDYSQRRAQARRAGPAGPAAPTGAGGPTCTLVETYCVTSEQSGLIQKGLTALPSGTTTPPAGYSVVPTRILQITGPAGTTTTTAPVTFYLDPALVSPQIVGYWNGTAWVQLTAGADGKYTVPAGAPLPLNLAVFTK